MACFGLRPALGWQPDHLVQEGPYRYSRNPQLVGGAVLWPSIYALGWVLLWGIIAHWMATTEEEHLRNLFGEAYERYTRRVPRYFGLPRRREDWG